MAALLPDIPQVEIAIIELTNRFRAEHRLGAVTRNAALTATARYFARYLARTGKFAHEADGRKPADRAKAKGYKFCQIAENLALHLDSRGFRTHQLAGMAVTGWKNSPGHRRNMLLGTVTQIGVAVAKAANDPKYISVQLFGRPLSKKYSYKLLNYSSHKVRYSDGTQKYRIAPREIVTHTGCFPVTVTFRSALRTSARGSKNVTHKLRSKFRVRRNDKFTLRDTATKRRHARRGVEVISIKRTNSSAR